MAMWAFPWFQGVSIVPKDPLRCYNVEPSWTLILQPPMLSQTITAFFALSFECLQVFQALSFPSKNNFYSTDAKNFHYSILTILFGPQSIWNSDSEKHSWVPGEVCIFYEPDPWRRGTGFIKILCGEDKDSIKIWKQSWLWMTTQ